MKHIVSEVNLSAEMREFRIMRDQGSRPVLNLQPPRSSDGTPGRSRALYNAIGLTLGWPSFLPASPWAEASPGWVWSRARHVAIFSFL